jgi:hypothetical protein
MFTFIEIFANIFEKLMRIIIYCNNVISVNNYNEIANNGRVFSTIFRLKMAYFRRSMLQ